MMVRQDQNIYISTLLLHNKHTLVFDGDSLIKQLMNEHNKMSSNKLIFRRQI
jgi:hypothetical protein